MQQMDITWDKGTAQVNALGAMLAPVTFRLEDGAEAQIMDIVPWLDDPETPGMPPFVQVMRGEWPSVPFGHTPDALPPDWPQGLVASEDEDFHGFSANNPWVLERCAGGGVKATIDYPADHVVKSLTRTVTPLPGRAELRLTLRVEVRKACRLPVGVHPTLRLPSETGAAEVLPGPHDAVWTYPADISPTPTPFALNQKFSALDQMEDRDGAPRDASRLPFGEDVESHLLLTGISGAFALRNHAEGYEARVRWNSGDLPALMLWISNRGRETPPFNNRHFALGVEPCCGAFDLGAQVGAAENPVAAAGTATSIVMDPATPFETSYSISATALSNN